MLLVVGRVVDWVSLAQSVVHDGLSQKAAFVKVTHVMVGEEGPTNDGTVEWKGTMEQFLNNHFEARLGSGNDVGIVWALIWPLLGSYWAPFGPCWALG